MAVDVPYQNSILPEKEKKKNYKNTKGAKLRKYSLANDVVDLTKIKIKIVVVR